MIATERLNLREMCDADVRDVYEILSDKETARWFGIKPVHSVDEARALMNCLLDNFFYKMLAITLKGEDKVIGFIQVTHRWDRSYSLGYCLHPSYRCKGYMTEAVKGLVSFIFENISWPETIRIGVFDGNEASSSVARKCGFFYDGMTFNVLSEYGNVEDEVHYSMTIGDYEWAHRKKCA